MPKIPKIQFFSNSSSETVSLGERIGEKLKYGDIVCLYGELGTGKTTIIKGIAKRFGISERDITSASFTIIGEYNSTTPFYHIDLYRLNSIESIEETGFFEYISSNGVKVIEWADRVNGYIECKIKIKLEYRGIDRRLIEIEGLDEEDWNIK